MSSNSNNSVLKGLKRHFSTKDYCDDTTEVDTVFSDDVWREKLCSKAVFSFGTTKVAFNTNFLFSLLEYIIKQY